MVSGLDAAVSSGLLNPVAATVMLGAGPVQACWTKPIAGYVLYLRAG
jgi:hypothetical protein